LRERWLNGRKASGAAAGGEDQRTNCNNVYFIYIYIYIYNYLYIYTLVGDLILRVVFVFCSIAFFY